MTVEADVFTSFAAGFPADVNEAFEAHLTAVAAALVDADDPAFLEAADRARGLFRAVCAIYSGGTFPESCPAVEEPDGELLLASPCPWPAGRCPDLSALAAALYRGGDA